MTLAPAQIAYRRRIRRPPRRAGPVPASEAEPPHRTPEEGRVEVTRAALRAVRPQHFGHVRAAGVAPRGSPEHVAKLGMHDAAHPAWKGDDAGYFPLHVWLNQHLPEDAQVRALRRSREDALRVTPSPREAHARPPRLRGVMSVLLLPDGRVRPEGPLLEVVP
jgi:hypothetical protein